MNKPRLAISFSGGRTSAVMTKLCVEKFRNTHDIAITFANTGWEHEETLKFVDRCDKHFGWGVVWLEAVVNPEMGVGIKHKIVTYETASRDGEPLEADFAKHGLAGPGYPHCTRDTKELPIKSYLTNELGWKAGTYQIAIGIRYDEIDRMSLNAKKFGYVYPLVKAGYTKEDVKRECAAWPFDLGLKGEHWGNCVGCWKKSMRKLMTLALEDESVFDFAKRVENKYSRKITGRNDDGGVRYMYRGRRNAEDIIRMAKTTKFEPYSDQDQMNLFSMIDGEAWIDEGGSCGDSCEIGADDY